MASHEIETDINNVKVGRVLAEDNDFMTIEIAKNDDQQLMMQPGDRYLMLVFLHHAASEGELNTLEAWLPWQPGT